MAEPYLGKDRNGQQVTGARASAVTDATIAQIEADHKHMHETGIIDLDGSRNRIRQACWDALDKYDAEHPEDINA